MLTTYAIAGADGLFIAKEVGGDSVDLIKLLDFHARVVFEAAVKLSGGRTVSTRSGQLSAAAQSLYDAQNSGIPIPPLTETYANLDVRQAYAVQRLNLVRRVEQGDVLRGHKIGLTSAPMQQLLGVSEPDFGYILDSMVLPDGPRCR